jgi:hypothetical protein
MKIDRRMMISLAVNSNCQQDEVETAPVSVDVPRGDYES